MQIYLVGGAVRDKLLGQPFHERDWVVVGATPDELLNLGYRQVGKDFPVFLHPETAEEYALARTERKVAAGYGGFNFDTSPEVTLEQDLLRRDLTINAIAEDDHGNLIDPYHGREDIKQKVLRHVSPAFAEDPLRVLRVARFAARYHHLGFTIADETLALMRELSRGAELKALTAERVWKETERALLEPAPQVFIDVLHQCGALAQLFPEIEALYGIPQRADYHPEVDTGTHLLMALEQSAKLSDQLAVRFAVLVHDLGKAKTPDEILPRHVGHESAGVGLVEAMCKRLRVPNKIRKTAVAVTANHLKCHCAKTLRPVTLLKLLKDCNAFRDPGSFKHFLLSCEADARGRLHFENREYPSTQWLSGLLKQLQQLDNKPLIESGLQGPELGAAISAAQLAVIEQYKRDNP